MSKSRYINKIALPIVLVIAAVAGLIASEHYFNPNNALEFKSLLVYPEAKSFSGFKLTNHNNKTLSVDYFADKWTLLFFGFTSCPDVCPTTLTELQKVFEQLKKHSPNNMPEVLFVSVDPDRDTPEVLKNYIKFFNPDFKAASANQANMLALTTQIGVAFSVEDHSPNQQQYSVDHTAAIFVIDPNKKLYGLFPTPHHADTISSDLLQLLGQE